jgi:hypothetical protein
MQPRVLVFFSLVWNFGVSTEDLSTTTYSIVHTSLLQKAGRQAGRQWESSTVSNAPPSWANWLITANSDTTYLPLTLVATRTCCVCCSCNILFPLELSFNLWAPKLLLKSASFFSISPLEQDFFGASKDSCNSVRLLPVHQLLELVINTLQLNRRVGDCS